MAHVINSRWSAVAAARPKPAPVRLADEDLVHRRALTPGESLPLALSPRAERVNLAGWIASHLREIEDALLEHGALLFRGFAVEQPSDFQDCARAAGTLLDYTERAAPRRQIHQRVYTSTEYPADQEIPLHHEMSYAHAWPLKIWFYCDQPAAVRGCTPIADDRKVIGSIDAGIRRRFADKQVTYVRNYGRHLDMPWPEVFQTDSPRQVEEYCARAGMRFEWRSDGRLRTWQTRPALATHPRTGHTVWFNHAHLFHSSSLDADVRETLGRGLAADDLPRHALFGDGTPIEDAILDEIRAVYRQTAVVFPWERGDVLMVDNVLTSHGREPFEGPRRILVAMADLHTP